MMLAIGGHKMARSSHLPVSILKVYIEYLTGFSHEYHSDGFNNTFLSEGCFSGGTSIPGTWEGVQLSGSRSWVNQWSCPLTDLLQHE